MAWNYPRIYGALQYRTQWKYLRSTCLTARLRNVGHDGDMTCIRSVVSTNDTYCESPSCHQPGSPTPLYAQPPVTRPIQARRLRLFGHTVRSDPQDLSACIDDRPKEWRCPRGRLGQTWLRKVDNRVWGCHCHTNDRDRSVPYRAHDRDLWRQIVETAPLQQEHAISHDNDDGEQDKERCMESQNFDQAIDRKFLVG